MTIPMYLTNNMKSPDVHIDQQILYREVKKKAKKVFNNFMRSLFN